MSDYSTWTLCRTISSEKEIHSALSSKQILGSSLSSLALPFCLCELDVAPAIASTIESAAHSAGCFAHLACSLSPADKIVRMILYGQMASVSATAKSLVPTVPDIAQALTDALNRTIKPPYWLCRGRKLKFGRIPLLMGILNITPDSFSDGGRHFDKCDALDRANQLIEEGADILDIGGQSTRPGSVRISVEEETSRILPIIEEIRRSTDIPISVDTYSSNVAQLALEAGADIVNDISSLRFSPDMAGVIAKYSAGLLLMHMQGEPGTMQDNPVYERPVEDISRFLIERISFAENSGVDPASIAVDPGIGFGKTLSHNLEILTRIGDFRSLGKPVLLGHSRKSFIGMVNGAPIHERDLETIMISVKVAVENTADIIRVHNVAIHRRSLGFMEKLL